MMIFTLDLYSALADDAGMRMLCLIILAMSAGIAASHAADRFPNGAAVNDLGGWIARDLRQIDREAGSTNIPTSVYPLNGPIPPYATPYNAGNERCRQIIQYEMIDGYRQPYGLTICLHPDGSWRPVR